jgi:hypothetical protein
MAQVVEDGALPSLVWRKHEVHSPPAGPIRWTLAAAVMLQQ